MEIDNTFWVDIFKKSVTLSAKGSKRKLSILLEDRKAIQLQVDSKIIPRMK